MPGPADDRVAVRNVNTPGVERSLNGPRYRAMRDALLSALPASSPGMTQKEMFDAVKAYLPESLFPGGATSGWWAKTVQLDLEARGVVVRVPGRPTRWHLGAAGEV